MEQARPLTIEELDLPQSHPVTRLLAQKQQVLANLSSSLHRERESGLRLLPGDRPKALFARELLPDLLSASFTLEPKDLIAIWNVFQRYSISEMQTTFMTALSLSYGIQKLDDKWKSFPQEFMEAEGIPKVPELLRNHDDLLTLEHELAKVALNCGAAVVLAKDIPGLRGVHDLLINDVKNGITTTQVVIGSELGKFTL